MRKAPKVPLSGVFWSEETVAKALELHAKGFGPYRIGDALGYDGKTVHRQFRRIGVEFQPQQSGWTGQEIAILQRCVGKGFDWRDTSAALKEAGYDRSPAAVQNKAAALRMKGKRSDYDPRTAQDGWPELVGSDEERDARYVHLCRLGLAEIYGLQVAA